MKSASISVTFRYNFIKNQVFLTLQGVPLQAIILAN